MNVEALVDDLPELYQPVFGHESRFGTASRTCHDRMEPLQLLHERLTTLLGRRLRVLDLGCAQGFFSLNLASRGAIVKGVDFCRENVALCDFLAKEQGLGDTSFECADLSDFVEKIESDQWDLVIGFSVFHHVIHTRGLDHARNLIGLLAKNVSVAVFEWALPVEPLYWAASLPASPWDMMRDFAFVHLLGQHSTHLSEHVRPTYFCSGRYWYFGERVGRFNIATTTSGRDREDTHLATRRLFDCDDVIVKVFAKQPVERLQLNQREWSNEIAFLASPTARMDAPEIIEHGENQESFWIVRSRYEGVTLDELIRARVPYDKRTVADDILAQLVSLEKEGLFHNDVRTWNIIVRTVGGARLIDFGSISHERRDVAWPFDLFLAFVITLNEIFKGEESEIGPVRSPWITPEALPADYAEAFWKLLEENTSFPSYARFQMLIDAYDGNVRALPGYNRITSAFNEALSNQKRLLRLASKRQDQDAGAYGAALDRLSLREQEFAELRAQTDHKSAEVDRLIKRIDELSASLDASELSRIGSEIKARELQALLSDDRERIGKLERALAEAETSFATAQSQYQHDQDHARNKTDHSLQLLKTALEDARLFRDQYERLLASSSWKITRPFRGALYALRWFRRGVLAWFRLKSGSRPRRFAKRALNKTFFIIQGRPKLKKLAKHAVAVMPGLRDRLQMSIEPLRIFNTAVTPPPHEDRDDHVMVPDDVRLAYVRLIHAQVLLSDANNLHEAKRNPAKLRLAYVSPLPPAKSGIADYSAQILPFLSKYYVIDLITPQDDIVDSSLIDHFPVRTVDWFERNAHLYDRVVYHFGNSVFHSHMLGLIEKIPGIVVLHDFYLGNLLALLELHGGWNNWWSEFLFRSHGYSGLSMRLRPELVPLAIHEYPANFPLIRQAQGIIVHNDFARQLCGRFYPAYDADEWAVIPLAKAVASMSRSEDARKRHGFKADDFVVCSFGFVQQNKLSHRLLDAWLASPLAKDPRCKLIYVGEAPYDEYGITLRSSIASAGLQDRVQITGFVAADIYEDYLHVADVAVQLRTLSRGETSAAVLDCLAHGLPTIINANGSMAEVPSDVVMALPDQFADPDLVAALTMLHADESLRNELRSLGMRHIIERHLPEDVAGRYHEAIELFAKRADVPDDLPKAIAHVNQVIKAEEVTSNGMLTIAEEARKLHPSARPSLQLLIDVSALVREDLRTGIQRVVRAQVIELLKNPPSGYRVQAVWLNNDFGIWRYHYAHKFTLGLMGLSGIDLPEDPVEVGSGDVFFGADFFAHGIVGAIQSGILRKWKDAGVRISFAVYDILPLTMPQYFPRISEFVHREWIAAIKDIADDLVCISSSVAADVEKWLKASSEPDLPLPRITACPLGADIDASRPTTGLPDDADQILATLTTLPTFLMVGTIEPRKGHAQVLRAFEQLWSEGIDIRLVIVGSRGWAGVDPSEARNIHKTVETIASHPERDQRLFWFEKASDEFLERIYSVSSCLLAASYGEGFGLPLIEAARHGKPIVARDIPVFREVAGQHAFYFEGMKTSDLASALKHWLDHWRTGGVPTSTDIRWLTWAQNVQRLKEVLFDGETPPKDGTLMPNDRIDASFFDGTETVAPPVSSVREDMTVIRPDAA